jgi:DNA-3-methyladenine glycosylase
MTARLPDLALPAPRLAPLLIGCELSAHGVRGRIVEVEAYHSERDLACHASRGRTPRSETLYAAPGTLYVYLCYGMHWMLNVVCGRVDEPSAVLIRALDISDGLALARRRRGRVADPIANGPGKVCQALALNRVAHGTRLGARDCPLRLSPSTLPTARRQRGPRIGVAYAGPLWAAKPWRWWEEGFPVVSPS